MEMEMKYATLNELKKALDKGEIQLNPGGGEANISRAMRHL
jgi:hypothetical protein